MSQRLLRVRLWLQAVLNGRQHLFVQVQDVLNIGKQNLGDKRGYDVKKIRNRGRGRKRKEGIKTGRGGREEARGGQGSGQPGGWRQPEQRHQSKGETEGERERE